MLNSVRDYDTLGFARFLREVFIYFLDVVSEPARLPKAKAPCMTPGITAGVGSVSVNDLCPPASSVSSFNHPGWYLSFFPPALHRSVLRVLSWTEREKKASPFGGKELSFKKNNRVPSAPSGLPVRALLSLMTRVGVTSVRTFGYGTMSMSGVRRHNTAPEGASRARLSLGCPLGPPIPMLLPKLRQENAKYGC